MKKFWLVILLVSLLFPLFSQDSGDQGRDWYLNKRIVDIRFTGLDTISENELRAVTKEFIGKEFSDSLSWEIQARLYALEYFDLITANILPGDAGNETVIISFNVEEKPSINDIVYSGNDRIRKSELRDTVLTTTGDILNNSSLRLDRDAIAALYLDKGFLNAKVEFVTEIDETANTAQVVFKIEEGIQTKISEIRIEGNSAEMSDRTLLGLMKTKPQSLFNKGIFVESQLQEDITAIKNNYRSRGYIDMDVVQVNRDIVLDEADGINKMVITLIIEEGTAYRFGTLTFSGNTIFSDDELRQNFSLLKADGILNMITFERGFQSINDLYYENGYIYNVIDYTMNKDETAGTVSFDVTIVERDRAHIENITVKGNDRTKDYVILREIPLETGDVFNRSALIKGWQNLMSTQYFSSVEPQTYQGSTDLLMDLVINVEEGQTANILFGMTFSGGPDFPISGQLQWSDSNVMGTGKSVGVSSQFSFASQSLSLKYNEPWLFGVRWSGGFDLTYTHNSQKTAEQDMDGNGIPDPYLTYDEYEANSAKVPTADKMTYESHYVSLGFSTGYTWPTNLGNLSASTSIRSGVEYVNYDQNEFTPYSSSISDNLHTWLYYDTLTVKGVVDNRDITYDPNKGYIFSQSLSVAGITSISTKQYFKTISKLGLYATLFDIPVNDEKNFKCVLSLDSAFSYIFEKPWIKDYTLDLSDEGFYIDGMFIARGWNVETGGKALWDSTLALKFPVIPQILTTDVFLDVVGMWNSDQALLDMQPADYRCSLGAGVRFANPSFPIGLYLVKKFTFDDQGAVDWNPEADYNVFPDSGLDLVIAFEMDLY
ncbi:MAG: outer membrane protein assembly factor BamA [Spirochaetales bacterium]|nr:outer membrane protein assembly factor BamA [Spirochaetales bacterium]